jgi:cell division protein FtsQ
VLLVGVGLGVRVLLYDSGLADVEGVSVTGLAAVPEPDVLTAAAVVPGGPLAAVDTAGIARRVVGLPGVAAVQVSRQWPHTVLVEVTERVPVALTSTPQGLSVVDTTGVVYRPAGPAEQALPRLTSGAVGPDDPGTRAALAVLAALPEAMRAQVRTLEVSNGTQVVLGLADDRQVRWGGPDRSAEKITVLGPLLTQPGTLYEVSSPDLPTVRR